jgi:DNA topoisomerase-1
VARRKEPSGRALVIVESPAKARTIAGYLGDRYVVEASIGHIRDLPQPSELPAELKKGLLGKFAVDVENGFEPYYVVDADKKKKVAELRRALKDADELLLATDEDREGEAIAWHLRETLQPAVPVRRMVFHEITREAIGRALEQTREIDDALVDAQETRRVLDRLYGYEVSPVLWRKVRQGLSAGRVQSVATRLVVERERERMAFVPAGYASVTATVTAGEGEPEFEARLVSLDSRKVAVGRDFDDRGRLATSDAVHLDAAAAQAVVDGLTGAAYAVSSVEEKPYTRRPAAPFTTSTLQQEASRKLRLGSRQAMRVAQTLYEGGYITYMRTDSTALSAEAVAAARAQARDLYGADSVPDSPRVYASKVKNAQEAHEAIRPAGDTFRTPAQVAGRLRGEEFRLYELIWQRTVASQMIDARGTTATVRIASRTSDGRAVEFGAAGTTITVRGFLAAYEEGRDAERHREPGDGPGAGGRGDDVRLPVLTIGQRVTALALATGAHTTSPPARYTEASLVRALEERGIGRPSTYAATLGTIIDRGYVRHQGSALVPEWLAFAVTRLLEEHFPRLVDYDFTAEMEADLDRVAAGEVPGSQWLARFYFGSRGNGAGGLPPLPGGAGRGLAGLAEGLKGLAEGLGDIDARAVSTIPIGDGLVLRVGRYGPYLEDEAAGDGVRASVPDDIAPDELSVARARALLDEAAKGDRVLGRDPDTGHDIVVKPGRFGPYVTEVLPEDSKGKARTASLFSSMSMDTVTVDDALRLLSLPRLVGRDPETDAEITAQNGRYGPYLKRGSDSRSLESEDQIFHVTLEQALEILRQPKRGRGRGAAASPLRELGPDPVSGSPITVRSGRYGPYVTDGTTNATLRSGDEPDTVTLERAAELLAEKRTAGPAKGPRKPPAKGARKAPAKRSGASGTGSSSPTGAGASRAGSGPS